MNAYRKSREYRLALLIAASQSRAMRHRVGTLENVSGTPCVIRKRRASR